jgi:hypothetical protein
MLGKHWIDEKLPKTSKDIDLNFEFDKGGRDINVDSSIIAWHYLPEGLKFSIRLFN